MNLSRFRLFSNNYYTAHQEGVNIHEAAEIAEARRSGRRLGEDIHVTWHPGNDAEIDSEARWLLKYGPANGVVVIVEK